MAFWLKASEATLNSLNVLIIFPFAGLKLYAKKQKVSFQQSTNDEATPTTMTTTTTLTSAALCDWQLDDVWSIYKKYFFKLLSIVGALEIYCFKA